MRIGIAHHLGWAVAVTASAGHVVVDRRRIELIEPGRPAAPVEHEARPLDDDAAARLVAAVRASALRATSASLDQLAASLPEPVLSMSLRAWPLDFPDDIAVQRRPPYAVPGRLGHVLPGARGVRARRAAGRCTSTPRRDVEAQAARILGERAGDVLARPAGDAGAAVTKDHRMALAATIVAG